MNACHALTLLGFALTLLQFFAVPRWRAAGDASSVVNARDPDGIGLILLMSLLFAVAVVISVINVQWMSFWSGLESPFEACGAFLGLALLRTSKFMHGRTNKATCRTMGTLEVG